MKGKSKSLHHIQRSGNDSTSVFVKMGRIANEYINHRSRSVSESGQRVWTGAEGRGGPVPLSCVGLDDIFIETALLTPNRGIKDCDTGL